MAGMVMNHPGSAHDGGSYMYIHINVNINTHIGVAEASSTRNIYKYLSLKREEEDHW